MRDVNAEMRLGFDAERRKYQAALRQIAAFGRANPGYGYSCSIMARKALEATVG